MSLDTFTNLKTEIAEWMDKSNLTAKIPTFISLCEADMFRRLRINAMDSLDTGTLSGATLAMPTGLKQIKLMKLTYDNQGVTIPYVSPQQFTDRYSYNAAGKPAVYTIIGTTIYFGPSPNDNFEYAIWGRTAFTALSDGDPTNWLLTNAPDAYLFGSLKQAEPYLRNDQRLMTWAAMYEAALLGIEQEDINDIPAGRSMQTSDMGTP